MSKNHQEEFTCPHCGAKGKFTVWDSINVNLDPQLRDKVLDESLFMWTCPCCGKQMYITFGSLYHDISNQFMILFDHKSNVENEDFGQESALPESEELAQFSKNYRLRQVHGILALKEKIFIFEEGLSDIVVELLKYFVINQVIHINESDPNFLIGKGIYFTNLSDDGENLVFAVVSPRKGVVANFSLSFNLYEQCLQKSLLDERFNVKKNCFLNVCYQWIDAQMQTSK